VSELASGPPVLTDALRFEWVRIRTLRSTYWLIGAALLINAVTALIGAYAALGQPHGPEFVGAIVTGGGPFVPIPLAAVFLAAIGVFATGHEYRYGTIQPALTALPRRSALLAAKLVVPGVVALVVAVVSMALNAAVALAVWGELPGLTAWPVDETMPGYLVLAVLWTVLGTALAQVFRGVPSALVLLLVVPLVVEQLVVQLSYVDQFAWLGPALRFLPFTAGQHLLDLGGTSDVDLFGRWASGGVFAVFVAVVVGAAWTTFTHRDA
jgi:ABC-2 type transport system permease protein